MRRKRGYPSVSSTSVALLLLLSMPRAYADPITVPGCTVTDLGAGRPTFSTDASGNGILIAPNGEKFAFPQTPFTNLTPGQGILANFPQLQAPPFGPDDYGHRANSFSYVTIATVNSSGLVVATNSAGIHGHYTSFGIYIAFFGLFIAGILFTLLTWEPKGQHRRLPVS
jgi:hypothetical protein